jgi:hypothetical protein
MLRAARPHLIRPGLAFPNPEREAPRGAKFASRFIPRNRNGCVEQEYLSISFHYSKEWRPSRILMSVQQHQQNTRKGRHEIFY